MEVRLRHLPGGETRASANDRSSGFSFPTLLELLDEEQQLVSRRYILVLDQSQRQNASSPFRDVDPTFFLSIRNNATTGSDYYYRVMSCLCLVAVARQLSIRVRSHSRRMPIDPAAVREASLVPNRVRQVATLFFKALPYFE